MRFRLGFLICLACAAAIAAPARPQSAAPSPRPIITPQDSVKITQIRHLLQIMDVTKQTQTMMQSLLELMQSPTSVSSTAGASTTSPPQINQFPALLQERVIAKMRGVDLVALYVPVYDKHYTLDDINALIAFYESPIGQKTVQLVPQVALDSMQSVMPTLQRITGEAEAEIRSEYPELATAKPADPIANNGQAHPVQRITKGGDVAMATAIHRVPPQYPESARRAGIQGTVRVHAIIDKDGRVIEVKYISGPAELAQAAIDAVKQWRFNVTTLQGVPIQVETFFELNFQLGR